MLYIFRIRKAFAPTLFCFRFLVFLSLYVAPSFKGLMKTMRHAAVDAIVASSCSAMTPFKATILFVEAPFSFSLGFQHSLYSAPRRAERKRSKNKRCNKISSCYTLHGKRCVKRSPLTYTIALRKTEKGGLQ